jgi:predicted ABC-type transport system involved in lysophospholipase L1 biosynthesis ATPase subunit
MIGCNGSIASSGVFTSQARKLSPPTSRGTSALDDQNAAEAINLLKELSENSGFALLVVTHDERVRASMDQVLDLGERL